MLAEAESWQYIVTHTHRYQRRTAHQNGAACQERLLHLRGLRRTKRELLQGAGEALENGRQAPFPRNFPCFIFFLMFSFPSCLSLQPANHRLWHTHVLFGGFWPRPVSQVIDPNKCTQQEDWGELYTGKRAPAVFVADLRSWKVQRVGGLPAEHSFGQPVWAPSGEPQRPSSS